MPIANIFLHGNIPAQLELCNAGEPLGISVETTAGVKWADFSQEELEAIADQWQPQINAAMEEFKREWDAWKYSQRECQK